MNSISFRLFATLTGIGVSALLLDGAHDWASKKFLEYQAVVNLMTFSLFAVALVAGARAMFTPIKQKIYDLAVPYKPETEDIETKRIAGTLSLVALFGMCLIVVLLIIDYFGHRKAAPLESAGAFLGTFGDFFGGVLNPILTFVTFIALAITLVLQRIQLKEAKDQAAESSRLTRLQSFETTFFNLLDLHNTTVSHLSFNPNDVMLPREERDEERRMRANPSQPRILYSVQPQADGRSVFASVLQTMKIKAETANILEDGVVSPTDIYGIIQTRHNYVLGHYFRNLYQILDYIDNYPHRLWNAIDGDDFKARKRYTNMVRAQLSANELALLYYNCGGNMVDDGAFRNLIKKYEILEHISVRYIDAERRLLIHGYGFDLKHGLVEYLRLVEKDGKTYYATGAFGQNPEVQRYLKVRNSGLEEN